MSNPQFPTFSYPPRLRAELEGRLTEEEVGRRVAAAIEERVAAAMGSAEVQSEVNQRLERERTQLEQQVKAIERKRNLCCNLY